MKAIVSIIMGSTSDLPVMEKAADLLNEFQIPFEMHALSAHRTPEAVEKFSRPQPKGNQSNYCRYRHGTPAEFALTTLPSLGPNKASLEGMDTY